MATSGTYTYFSTLESVDILQDAFERCGIDFSKVSGNQLDSARRSLQMLIASDWSNRGPNLWKVTLQSSALAVGQSTITLNSNVIEVLQAYITDSSVSPSIDYVITGISRSDYAALPYKTQAGDRPTQFYFERTSTPTIFLWPVQNNTTKTFNYYSWRIAEDVGSLVNQIDAPNRWIDAATAGLAARLAMKFATDRYELLQKAYLDTYNAAAAEDTESVPLRVTPNMQGQRWGM
jgi:hypothetical protein